MKTSYSKRQILSRIKEGLNLTSDTELANLLGINKSTLANWYSRNTMDYDLVFSICEHLNLNWILTGEGEMLANPDENELNCSFEPDLTSDYERKFLEKQLDKKDNEIAKLTQKIIQLNKEVGALEERIKILNSKLNGEDPS